MLHLPADGVEYFSLAGLDRHEIGARLPADLPFPTRTTGVPEKVLSRMKLEEFPMAHTVFLRHFWKSSGSRFLTRWSHPLRWCSR